MMVWRVVHDTKCPVYLFRHYQPHQLVREHLQSIVGEDDIEADIARFRELSGLGKPDAGWKFNRDEIYEERLGRYGKS